jgi:hypothetical protein
MQTRTVDLPRLAGLQPAPGAKQTFRDRYELRSYARAVLLAKRLTDDPDLVARGHAYLERFVGTDPRQQRIYALWVDALRLPLEDMLRDLLADTARGAALRETAPVFVVIPADDVRVLVSRAA